ncbi:type IX secretion system membrane protein, PorP/SprF family [Polaribacter sp. KT25b]|uniref:PorP/SprF family type IX secretion system membrane protein n=1 Tax=Polaribacter sp. KT25b TaxID=1855336 RepID=UPI00087BA4DC|nr:type IX secretion system membrane protein PorP/SprF [Polaribacter sp. KT25b]SDS36993.1 type IX secretion system membrane protein, PorP/SprF family [Polaribacter sp. KT25b]
MKLLYINFCLLTLFFFSVKSYTQETLPIYQDYLSDNVYLVHPSAAGIGNSSKLRFTARQQWSGIPNAPALQTMSFHTRLSEDSNAGYGFVLFNDKNGYHSQKGLQGTYSYHLPMSNGTYFNQLSFGLAFTFVQNQSDQRTFTGDQAVSAIIESTSYYNADFSVAYHLGGFSSYFTVKNLLLTAKNNLNIQEPLDLRNYIFSTGYYFGEDLVVQFEPSVMLQFRESTGERIADLNIKAYKNISKTQLWAALSYRKSFDTNAIENSQFISPIIGLNFENFMFSYTYTNQMNETVLTTSGFHQISLGLNLWTRKQRASACPNINSAFGSF